MRSSPLTWSRACVFLAAAGALLSIAAAPARAAPPDTIEQRVMACTGCHGLHGEGSAGTPYVPRLAGLPARYIREQLTNFREGTRHYLDMNFLLSSLSDSYIEEISNYFSNLPAAYGPIQSANLSAQEAARAETLVRHGDPSKDLPACTRCHGEALTGVQPAVPGLLGLPRDYVRAQLGGWRNGERHGLQPDCMATIVERLNPADIALVSAWLSSRTPGVVDRRPAASLPEQPPMACGSLPVSNGGREP